MGDENDPNEPDLACTGCGSAFDKADVVNGLCGWCRDDDHPDDT